MSGQADKTQFIQDARAFQSESIFQDPPIAQKESKPMVFPARRQILFETGPQILIQVLCQDEASKVLAEQRFRAFPWARPLQIPREVQKDGLFENAVYLSLLADREKEWQSVEYVGLLSYKSFQRIPVHFLNAVFTCGSKEIQRKYLSDDCVFFQGSSGTVHSTNRVHPQFSKIWNDILVKQFGIRSEEISCFNYWMCRPTIMKKQILFFPELFEKLLKHPDAYQNAKYTGGSLSPDDLLRVNSMPQQTHIPFILERVPRNWALHNEYSVCVYNYLAMKNDFKDNVSKDIFESLHI